MVGYPPAEKGGVYGLATEYLVCVWKDNNEAENPQTTEFQTHSENSYSSKALLK